MERRNLIGRAIGAIRSAWNSTPTVVWMDGDSSGGISDAGIPVTQGVALSVPAIWCAVRRISEDLGMLPLHVYRRDVAHGGRDKASDHRLYRLLHTAPNPLQTAMEWRSMTMANLLIRGNAYSEIERDASGRVRALWWLDPSRMTVSASTDGRDLRYDYRLPDGTIRQFASSQILHVRGFSTGGLLGVDPIKTASDTIGHAKALLRYLAKFFRNGASPSAVVTHPMQLSAEARAKLGNAFSSMYCGVDNSHRVVVLDEGMKWEARGVSPVDAQALEGCVYSVLDVARIFGIPPHLLMELTHATFTNIEHQGIEYVTYTLGPWLARLEQRMHISLFDEEEQAIYYPEFSVDGLLRGDTNTRYEAYGKLWNIGSITPNEIRERENLPPLAGESGDMTWIQINMAPMQEILNDRPWSHKAESLDLAAPPTGDTKASPSLSNSLPPSASFVSPVLTFRAEPGVEARLLIRQRYNKAIADAWKPIIEEEVSDLTVYFDKRLSDLPEARGINDDIDAALDADEVSEIVDYLEEYYSGRLSETEAKLAAAANPMFAEFAEAASREVGSAAIGDMTDWTNQWLRSYVTRHGGECVDSLDAILRTQGRDGLRKEIAGRLDDWTTNDPARLAGRAVTQSDGAIAREAWRRAGVKKITWRLNAGENCDICKSLDGRTVGIEESFVPQGTSITGEGQGKLWAGANILHPPIHDGCMCSVSVG